MTVHALIPIGERRLIGDHAATVTRVDRMRVYWVVASTGQSGWSGINAWRKLEQAK